MTPTLLAYQIDPKKLGKMQIVCLRLGIRVQAVDPADFGQTIGALAGVLPREPDAPAAPLPGEMLVMAHFRPALCFSSPVKMPTHVNLVKTPTDWPPNLKNCI